MAGRGAYPFPPTYVRRTTMADVVAVAIIAIVVALAIRALRRGEGGCSGDCERCAGECHCGHIRLTDEQRSELERLKG